MSTFGHAYQNNRGYSARLTATCYGSPSVSGYYDTPDGRSLGAAKMHAALAGAVANSNRQARLGLGEVGEARSAPIHKAAGQHVGVGQLQAAQAASVAFDPRTGRVMPFGPVGMTQASASGNQKAGIVGAIFLALGVMAYKAWKGRQ